MSSALSSFISNGMKAFAVRLAHGFKPSRCQLSLRLQRVCDSKASMSRFPVASSQLPLNFSFTNQRADSFLVSGVNLEAKGMNVIVFASRKGGSGKSTLAAHLAAQIKATKPCLLVDAD